MKDREKRIIYFFFVTSFFIFLINYMNVALIKSVHLMAVIMSFAILYLLVGCALVVKKGKILHLLMVAGLLFMVVGGIMNLIAISGNGLQMPVYTPASNIEVYQDFSHFHFTNPDDVNFFGLTDIYALGIGIGSIGDIYIGAGMLLILINISMLLLIKAIRKWA